LLAVDGEAFLAVLNLAIVAAVHGVILQDAKRNIAQNKEEKEVGEG
jgi:hypothetical protein